MGWKIDPNTLQVRDYDVMKYNVLQGKTIKETARLMNTSVDTVKRIKRKPAFRDLMVEAIERNDYNLDLHAKRLIRQTTAQKSINIGGAKEYEDDNPSILKALDMISNIYGLYAPKQLELAGATGASDEELASEIEEALGEQGLALEAGEQSDSPEDSGDVEGTIL
jgi:hypothetical protein